MKMMICQACEKEFPQARIVDGVRKYFNKRKFCFECSPSTRKNTKDITRYPLPKIIDGIIHKTCRGCKKELPYIEEFFYMKSVWGKTRSLCKQCSKENKNKRTAENKRWAVEYKGGECMLCGYKKYIGSLDFHHTDPTKKDFAISSGKSNKEKLKAELDKCVLVCSNCHREIHAGIVSIKN